MFLLSLSLSLSLLCGVSSWADVKKNQLTAQTNTETVNEELESGIQFEEDVVLDNEDVVLDDIEPLTSSKTVKDSRVEKIRVTGSRIKRIDIEGVSPVIIHTKEELENSGYFSVSDFLKNTSLSNFGGTEVHNRSTLALVNGKRLVYDSAPDLIPLSAIDRIEILKDGAAALYGSDVIGGVINIITKTDIDANEISLKLAPTFPFNKGGNELEGSFTFAEKLPKGNFITSFQAQYNQALKYKDRPNYYEKYFIPFADYPNFIISKDIRIVDEKCPKDQLKNKLCQKSLVSEDFINPRTFSLFNYSYLEYDLPDDLTFYSHLIGIFSDDFEPKSPIIDELKLPANHKMSQGRGSAGKLQYIFKEREWDQIDRLYFLEASAGLKGYISKTWDLDVSLKWSNIWNYRHYKDALILDDLKSAVISGKYDPFNPEVRDLSSVGLHRAIYKDYDARLFTSLDFSGESVWGVNLALGLQAYYNRYSNTPDSRVKKGEIYALAPAETGLLKRAVGAGYIEAVKTFNDQLELQAAWRLDYYSDFGFTDFGLREFLDVDSDKIKFLDYLLGTPKLALRYQPTSNFLLRASVGTSFDAPDLDTLNSPESEGFISVYDTPACYSELGAGGFLTQVSQSLTNNDDKTKEQADKMIKEFLIEQEFIIKDESLSEKTQVAFKDLTTKLSDRNYCKIISVRGLNKGNKDLNPVKALTGSLGGVLELGDNHTFRFDYWYNLLKGRTLSSIHRNKKTMDAELRYGKAYVEKLGVKYKRDPNREHNPVIEPVNQVLNLAANTLHGFDFIWHSDFPSFIIGTPYFKNEFSYVVGGSIEIFPGMGFVSNIGKFGLPKWRNFAALGWKYKKHNLSFLLKSTAGTKKLRNEFESLKSGHLLDLFYQYKWNPKISINTGFYNVLFLNPVFDDSITQGLKFDTSFYNTKGPSYFVELRAKI